MFEIETATAIYELELSHVQINITSRCNMKCEHCRGSYGAVKDLPIDDFERVIRFSKQHLGRGAGYLISGGEPLLYPQFRKFFFSLRRQIEGDPFVALTTNGTFVDRDCLEFLRTLDFPDLRISVSLDSVSPERHNLFRHSPQAFNKAVDAIKLITMSGIKCIVRATIQKDQIDEIAVMADMLESLGADVLSVSSVIPVGRALGKQELCFGKTAKRRLIELVADLRKKHKRLLLDVNDPLAYVPLKHIGVQGEFGGCIAGIGSFSIEPDGSMYPCPVLPGLVIMNITGMPVNRIMANYSNSQIIHSLIERKLTGKCGSCKLRFSCGGCRARAAGTSGNYLGEDPDCWLS